MLSVLDTQLLGLAVFLLSSGLILRGLVRRARPSAPVTVVARRPPLRGTGLLWVVGTLTAAFWPVGALVLPFLAYHWPALPDVAGSWAVQVVGAALVVAGGALFGSASRVLGVHMTPAIQAQEGHRLVQDGPYRWVRHPVYTAVLTISLGQTLLFLSPVAALLTVVLVILAVDRARLEEELLRSPQVFGDAYEAYRARTGRFLPRLGGGSGTGPDRS
jgi:protein-S-isoprenylcysteine O-methyltransferase Ste14